MKLWFHFFCGAKNASRKNTAGWRGGIWIAEVLKKSAKLFWCEVAIMGRTHGYARATMGWGNAIRG